MFMRDGRRARRARPTARVVPGAYGAVVWAKRDWRLYDKGDGVPHRFTLLNTATGFLDFPLRYDNRVLGFDRRDQIPEYVQAAVDKRIPKRYRADLLAKRGLLARQGGLFGRGALWGRRAFPGPRLFHRTAGQALTPAGHTFDYHFVSDTLSAEEARRQLLPGQPLPGSPGAPTYYGMSTAISLRGTGAWLIANAGPGYFIVAPTEGDVARAGGHVAARGRAATRGHRAPAAMRIGKTVYTITRYRPPDPKLMSPRHEWGLKGPRGADYWLFRGTRRGSAYRLVSFGSGSERVIPAAAVRYLPETVGPRVKPKKPKAKRAPKGVVKHPLKVGSILVSSWGYDQTNVDFYEVVALRGATGVTICPIAARRDHSEGYSDYLVAVPGACTGAKQKRKASLDGWVKVDYGSAHPWNGRPQYATSAYAGH